MPPRDVKVYVRRVAGRPLQLKYWCPTAMSWIRQTAGTHDVKEAKGKARQLEAELLTKTYSPRNPKCSWQSFVKDYDDTELKVNTRARSREKALSVLGIADRYLKPASVGDVADKHMLKKFRTHLLTLTSKRTGDTLSKHTVKSYMATLNAALRWAEEHDYIHTVPRLKAVKASKLDSSMKGRPLTDKEFEAFLAAVPAITGEPAADSWCRLLKGIWHSALRLEEALELHWTSEAKIRPIWVDDGLPLLRIPAAMQKNDSDDQIPMLPDFEKLITETAPGDRRGFIFDPLPLPGDAPKKFGRLKAGWVGKIISRIGEHAKIVVNTKVRTDGTIEEKFASAHDLRRSCCQRLLNAGVSPLIVQRLMRHSSLAVTLAYYSQSDVQADAKSLREKLEVGHTSGHSSTQTDATARVSIRKHPRKAK